LVLLFLLLTGDLNNRGDGLFYDLLVFGAFKVSYVFVSSVALVVCYFLFNSLERIIGWLISQCNLYLK